MQGPTKSFACCRRVTYMAHSCILIEAPGSRLLGLNEGLARRVVCAKPR
jgi:hypothetical protein